MSRTSTALKRLGVAALATVTIGAGVPAFFATGASAATGDVISLTPDSDSASTGTCNEFTIQVTNGGQAAQTRTVDVVVTERNQAASETADVTFCTVRATTSGANTTAAGFSGQTQAATTFVDGTNQDNDQAEFVTDQDGKIVFGIISNEPQVVDVRAFIEDDNNDRFNQGEITDTPSVKTFTQGGDDAVTRITATPASETNFTGETHTITVTAFNAEGDTVSGADIGAVVESGVNQGTQLTCADRNNLPQTGGTAAVGTTNNNGQTICTYSSAVTGNDTIRVFADETGRRSGTEDTGEPATTVTKTWTAAPTGLQIDLTCDGGGTTREDCINPPSSNTETFTAYVTKADSADTDTDRDPAAGVLVRFAVTSDPGVGGNDPGPNSTGTTSREADATVSPTSCTTDATGRCSTTLTEPTARNGEVVAVRATIAGQDPAGDNAENVSSPTGERSGDTATKTFANNTAGDARYVDLTPESSTQTATTFEVQAKVTDEFGNPVAGVTVTFTENGAAEFANGTSSATAVTNSAGIATATVRNPGNGSSTVTATLDAANTECDEPAAAATTGDTGRAAVAAGNCTDSETYTLQTPPSPAPSQSQSPSPAPGCATAQQNLPVRFQAPQARVSRTGAFGPVVNATALVTVTVTGATPNGVVELQAYQQNHFGTANFANAGNTRTATANASGVATFQVRFSSNARARAKMQGCAFGTDAGFNQGTTGAASNVLYVRTVITFTVTRVGTRTIRIVGDSIPARPGGLIVNIHCTDARCKSASNPNGILFQPRANAVTGEFGPVTYTFPATFQNNRVTLYAATGRQDTGEGDAQNVAGRSNNRVVLIY